MPTTSVPNRIRRGKPLGATITDPLICMISIGRDTTGAPTGLKVLPARAEDAHLYYPKSPRGGASTGLPHQLVWVVNQLRPGERVRIEAKAGTAEPDLFATRVFEIAYPNQYVATGPVKSDKRTGAGYTWGYDVTLTGAAHPVPKLDPTVVVTQEP